MFRFFNDSIAAVFPHCSRPVFNINMHTGGKYCFVEFKDREMCTAALDLNGFSLLGCVLSVNRPNSYNK